MRNPGENLDVFAIDDRKKYLEPYVSKGQVAADLGCNTGHFSALAARAGAVDRVCALLDADPGLEFPIDDLEIDRER